MLALAVLLVLIHRCCFAGRETGYRLRAPKASPRGSRRAKPLWVRKEVIRLKALMHESGSCRVIASVFNRRHASTRNITVGRTFVAGVIRAYSYEIEVLQRSLKNRKPRPVPKNLVWAIDLTGKPTLDGRTKAVLGTTGDAAGVCTKQPSGLPSSRGTPTT